MRRLEIRREEQTGIWIPDIDEQRIHVQQWPPPDHSRFRTHIHWGRDQENAYDGVVPGQMIFSDHVARSGTPDSVILQRLEAIREEQRWIGSAYGD